jgi:hypothetical protein
MPTDSIVESSAMGQRGGSGKVADGATPRSRRSIGMVRLGRSSQLVVEDESRWCSWAVAESAGHEIGLL